MSPEKCKAFGTLHYEKQGKFYKLVALTDQGIADAYRALIPKWYPVKGQRYRAHVSVVRREIPPKLSLWGKYEGEVVEFEYGRMIHNDDFYWWLNVHSKRFEEIRMELGLARSRYPDGLFHITIGNTKVAL